MNILWQEKKPLKYRMEIQILFSKYYLFLRAWVMLGLGKLDYKNKFISLPSSTHLRLLCLPYEQQSHISLYLAELPINFPHNPNESLCAAAASFIANDTLDVTLRNVFPYLWCESIPHQTNASSRSLEFSIDKLAIFNQGGEWVFCITISISINR